MDEVRKKGRLKFNPKPVRGLNPGPSGWQSKIISTVSTLHTHFKCVDHISKYNGEVKQVNSAEKIYMDRFYI